MAIEYDNDRNTREFVDHAKHFSMKLPKFQSIMLIEKRDYTPNRKSMVEE